MCFCEVLFWGDGKVSFSTRKLKGGPRKNPFTVELFFWNPIESPKSSKDSAFRISKKNTGREEAHCCLDLFCLVIFLLFYHGKSPLKSLNHHLGQYFWKFFQPPSPIANLRLEGKICRGEPMRSFPNNVRKT